MADVGEEALAADLAVVDDVEADLDLLGDRRARRRVGRARERAVVDRLAGERARVERRSSGERGRLPAWVVRMRSSLFRTGLRLALG